MKGWAQPILDGFGPRESAEIICPKHSKCSKTPPPPRLSSIMNVLNKTNIPKKEAAYHLTGVRAGRAGCMRNGTPPRPLAHVVCGYRCNLLDSLPAVPGNRR